MLNGRVAVVTGATGGIGMAIADRLCERGCNVLIHGFGDPEQVEGQRRDLIERHGVDVVHSPVDLGRSSEVPAIVSQAMKAFGRLDILVNNAGIQQVDPLESFAIEDLQTMLAVNLMAPLLLVRSSIPHMRAGGWGRIINIGSVHSLVASAFKVPYVTAKHGLVGLTKGAAVELGPYGITCNAIAPGFVDTPLFRSQAEGVAHQTGVSLDELMLRQVSEKHVTDRLVRPAEIADCVGFLCSESAASITGVVLPVDGGWVAQ